IQACIVAIDAFFRSMGVGTHFSDYGLGEDAVKKVVERYRQRGWVLGERQNITVEVVERMLRRRL
ncbi:MAG: NADH-dependent alcohol dehydrogenase, partial [Bacteroidia bacterium]|nr:NADH-dependent alcohol dehydrogenase [Bacteroidia bacterium]